MPQVIINKDASDTRIRVNKVPRFPRTPVFRSRSPAEIDRALSLATVADHYFPGSSPNLALTLETPSSRVGCLRGRRKCRRFHAILTWISAIFRIISFLTRHERERGEQSGRIRNLGGRRGPRKQGPRGSLDPRGSQRRCFFETGISRAIPSNLRSLRPREFDHEMRYLVHL